MVIMEELEYFVLLFEVVIVLEEIVLDEYIVEDEVREEEFLLEFGVVVLVFMVKEVVDVLKVLDEDIVLYIFEKEIEVERF